jgi:tripartite-type tricarboxylate transporter receptor subunit TctC
MRHLLCALAFALPLAAQAQSWPAKPIRMIMPYPAGGIDSVGRLIAQKMGESLGQPLVVENRVGANGNIGTEHVARAAPDGYTVLFAASSTLVIGPHLYRSVPFDPVKDFTGILIPIAGMATVAVNPNVPVRSLKELIDHARKNPGKLSYGSSGIGSIFHLTAEQLKHAAGIDLFHVPYKAAGPAWLDLMAGRIDVGFPAIGEVRQHVATGKLRLIAVAEAKRHPQLPDLPTVSEMLPGFEKPPSWFGLFAPAGISPTVHARLADASRASLNDNRPRLEESGYVILGHGPEEIPGIMKRDLERTARLMKTLGIQPE